MNMSDQMSVNSNYSRGSHASSQQSSQVDEAYRRLGHRLSRRAHGDQPVLRPQRLEKLGLTIGSGFVQYLETQQGNDGGEISRDGAQDVRRTYIRLRNQVNKRLYYYDISMASHASRGALF
jgi:hypothetical protein